MPTPQARIAIIPLAEKAAALSGNRRGERRFACKLGAEVYRLGSNVPNRCTLSDVSEGGCYVEMPSPLAEQTGVEIVVRTPDMKLKIRGQVLAVHPGFGMGVQFTFRRFRRTRRNPAPAGLARGRSDARRVAALGSGSVVPRCESIPGKVSALRRAPPLAPIPATSALWRYPDAAAWDRPAAGVQTGSGFSSRVTAITFCAHSRIVNSVGFPMFTGSCSDDRESRRMPSTSSLT